MIMPFKIYNYDCPYCGSEDSIMFITNDGHLAPNIPNRENVHGAGCKVCRKKFAINWDKDGNYFSDFRYALDKFMRDYVDQEKRDIDKYIIDDITLVKELEEDG